MARGLHDRSVSALFARFGISAAVLSLLAVWERLKPMQDRGPRLRHWAVNLSLQALNAGLLALGALAYPGLLLAAAYAAEDAGFGLLAPLPWPVKAAAGFVALDLVVYFQHRLLHTIPLLWPLHRLHHTEETIDVTTGFRFHPAEIAVSLLVKGAAVVLLGVPFASVGAFEVLLNAFSLFAHANIALPVERLLRPLIVTPVYHLVHHSSVAAERDSNYAFQLSCWDRLFGTYTEPR